MNFFKSFLFRMVLPHIGKFNFTQPYAYTSSLAAKGWLLAAVISDILVQAQTTELTWWRILGSLSTMVMFYAAPPLLTGAISGMYLTQAWVSLLIVNLLPRSISEFSVNVVLMGWQLWSMFALFYLLLTYLRTPKLSLPSCNNI